MLHVKRFEELVVVLCRNDILRYSS